MIALFLILLLPACAEDPAEPPPNNSPKIPTNGMLVFYPFNGDALDKSGNDNNATLLSSADLAVTKSDGLTSANPGNDVTYTITVTNIGPSDSTGATVVDTFDPSFFNVAGVTWTCSIRWPGIHAAAVWDTGMLAPCEFEVAPGPVEVIGEFDPWRMGPTPPELAGTRTRSAVCVAGETTEVVLER